MATIPTMKIMARKSRQIGMTGPFGSKSGSLIVLENQRDRLPPCA